MSEVFHQAYTRPVPPDAQRVKVKIRKRGKTVEVEAVRLKQADGRVVVAPLVGDGSRCRVESPVWYGNVKLPDGSTDRVPLSTNKAAAELMLRQRQAECDRAKALGLPLEQMSGRREGKTLADWLTEYETAIRTGSRRRTRRGKGKPDEDHVQKTLTRLRSLLTGCGFTTPNDIELRRVQTWLEEQQAPGTPPPLPDLPKGETGYGPGVLARLLGISLQALAGMARRHGLVLTGNGKARRMARSEAERLLILSSRRMSEKTAGYYSREARAFTAWLVRREALTRDPLIELPGATLQPSHRHDRRPLEEDEVAKLLDATKASKRAFRGLTGLDRWALYLVALSTGFRASELSSLTPAHFRLDDLPPVLLLGKQASKNDQGATQPLPPAVVPLLRAYIEGKSPHLPVWPATSARHPWPRQAALMLRRDLEDAGVPAIVPGPDGPMFADFHGLRHTFVARLDLAGVPLKLASELARHSTIELTAKIYARPRLKDMAAAVAHLGAPGESGTQQGST